jgi:AraC-like DNA-binding protein
MTDVAAQLGITPWTLRRKLQREGATFQDLLEETRRSLAESYVRDTELTFGEIAFRLGFSSPAAFHRAFRRWTSVSPGTFRGREG